MKKRLLLSAILAWMATGYLAAQTYEWEMHPWYRLSWTEIRDTNYDGYLFNKPFDTTNSCYSISKYRLHAPASNLIVGCRYYAEAPVQIHGVATTIEVNENVSKPFLDVDTVFNENDWAVILKKDGSHYVVTDSVKTHVYYRPYKYIQNQNDSRYYLAPDVLFHVSCRGGDQLYRLFEYYFESPITIEDTFYVGIKHPNNNDSTLCNCLVMYGYAKTFDRSYVFDELLILEDMEDTFSPVYSDEYNCRNMNPYFSIFPIIKPYEEDSVFCDTVPGFHLAGTRVGYPTFAWDTDWFREEDLFEVQFAPYRPGEATPDEAWRTVSTADSSVEVYAVFDPDIYYQARVRARRHHLCPIHDTLMWGPWCRPILFYTGPTAPDTSTAIATVEADGEGLFTLAPNPTDGRVRVEIHTPSLNLGGEPSSCSLTVCDAVGHEVLRQVVTPAQTAVDLDLSSLAAGTYLVTLSTPAATGTQRLVVK